MSSRTWLPWLAGGALLYLLLLLLTLPATQLTGRVTSWLAAQPQAPALQLRGVSGTWWRGRAEALWLEGRDLGSLRWSWRPAALLRGRFGLTLAMQGGAAHGRGRLAVSPDGRLFLQALTLELPAAELPGMLPRLPVAVEAAGQLRLTLERAMLAPDGVPRQLAGQLEWREARLLGPLKLQLGHLVAELAREETALVARLADRGGALALGGEARLNPTNGHYRLDLRLRARNNPQLRDSLALLGSPDVRGVHRLARSGRLNF